MRAHGLTACDCLWFIFCVNLYFWFIFSPSPQIWGVGGRFLAQASIQILELIYECNFQMDTNAAPLRLASAQNMNTAENYRNNSSKERNSLQDTVCPSAAWRCWLWLIECHVDILTITCSLNPPFYWQDTRCPWLITWLAPGAALVLMSSALVVVVCQLSLQIKLCLGQKHFVFIH